MADPTMYAVSDESRMNSGKDPQFRHDDLVDQ